MQDSSLKDLEDVANRPLFLINKLGQQVRQVKDVLPDFTNREVWSAARRVARPSAQTILSRAALRDAQEH